MGGLFVCIRPEPGNQVHWLPVNSYVVCDTWYVMSDDSHVLNGNSCMLPWNISQCIESGWQYVERECVCDSTDGST